MSSSTTHFPALLINPENRRSVSEGKPVINYYVIPITLQYSPTPPHFSAGEFSEENGSPSTLSVSYTYDTPPSPGADSAIYPFVFRKQYASNENNPIDLQNVELKVSGGDPPKTKSGVITINTEHPLMDEYLAQVPANYQQSRVWVFRQWDENEVPFGPYYITVLNLTDKSQYTNKLLVDGTDEDTLLFRYEARAEAEESEEWVAAFGVMAVADTHFTKVAVEGAEAEIDYDQITYF